MMNGRGKSDSAIVAERPTNKAGRPAEEPASITASQLRESLLLFPGGFQREQLLILMRAGAESAFAPRLPADPG